MYYSDEIIEEVRSRNDIVDVISTYVKLQKKGSSYFGLCPFHNEKSPSFSVSRQKQMYYCFGCGAGGNVFTFISKIEGIGFKEAIENLADRAGIVLPKPSNKYQEIVHLADYLASRKPLDMEFDEWKKPELPPLDTYVLNFGKYKDERLVEVAQKDKGYIDWLKENYGREPVRSLLKQL